MIQFALKTRAVFAANRPYSQRLVAAESDVHEDVVSRWHRVPGFDEWFSDEVLGEANRAFPLAMLSAVRRAIRTGDPKEVETLARLLGRVPTGYQDPDAPAAATVNNYNLNLLVPRPDMPALTPAR